MRTLRRTFAAPLVLIAACESQSHVQYGPNPPAPNPPAPQQPEPANAGSGSGSAIASDRPVHPMNPPAPQEPAKPLPPVMNPPPPVARADLHWSITRSGSKCTAFSDDACKFPDRKPDEPVPPCNPPPPMDYPCQKQVADASYKIVQHAGDTQCFTDPFVCPPNAKCKPTPPAVEVACPK